MNCQIRNQRHLKSYDWRFTTQHPIGIGTRPIATILSVIMTAGLTIPWSNPAGLAQDNSAQDNSAQDNSAQDNSNQDNSNPVPSVSESNIVDQLGLLGESSELNDIATAIVRNSLAEQYENRKEWGQTKSVWDGLHVSLDGGQIKTKRRWKDVNHGSWKMYRFWPIQPERELSVRIFNLRQVEPGRAGLDLEFVAKVGAFARWSEWRRGLQIFSLSADAEANVRLTMSCELGTKLDAGRFPPDLVLLPVAKQAHLELLDFRLIHLSDLRGPVARELGDSLEGVLRREIRDQEGKLVDRINSQIKKQADKLRVKLGGGT